MKASEALEKASKSGTTNYPSIQSKIAQAVNNGEMFIWWYKPLSKRDRELILQDGYTIPQEGDDRDGYLAKISWAPEAKDKE